MSQMTGMTMMMTVPAAQTLNRPSFNVLSTVHEAELFITMSHACQLYKCHPVSPHISIGHVTLCMYTLLCLTYSMLCSTFELITFLSMLWDRCNQRYYISDIWSIMHAVAHVSNHNIMYVVCLEYHNNIHYALLLYMHHMWSWESTVPIRIQVITCIVLMRIGTCMTLRSDWYRHSARYMYVQIHTHDIVQDTLLQ